MTAPRSRKVLSRIFDVRVDRWMSWDYLSETADRYKVLLVDMVIPKKATYSETFDEALERMQLTQEDINQRKQEFTRLFYFFLALSLLVVCYALYMAFRGYMVPALISFCLAFYAFTQAFRFNFWLFQIKHRKLGCTIKEWMNSTVNHTPKKEVIVKRTKDISKSKDDE